MVPEANQKEDRVLAACRSIQRFTLFSPAGKPAGVRCVQLTADSRCAIFGHPERPTVCGSLRPSPLMRGTYAAAAMRVLTDLELATRPD